MYNVCKLTHKRIGRLFCSVAQHYWGVGCFYSISVGWSRSINNKIQIIAVLGVYAKMLHSDIIMYHTSSFIFSPHVLNLDVPSLVHLNLTGGDASPAYRCGPAGTGSWFSHARTWIGVSARPYYRHCW